MPFVSFSLFHIFILSVCFLFSLVFSLLSLPFFTFSVCVSFSVSSSRSHSWSLSTVSLSSFLTFLLFLGSLSSSSNFFSFPLLLFLPPSPLPSFPYVSSSFSFPLWVILNSPLLPLSRLLSRSLFPFGSVSLSVASYLSFPPISLFLVRLSFFPSHFFSPSCCLFLLLVCPHSSLLCSSSKCFSFLFLCLVLLLFLRLLPLGPVLDLLRIFVPLFIYLASSFSASLASSSFSA